MAAGLLWMHLLNLIYGKFRPLIPLYSDTWPLTGAYLLFGACVAVFSSVFLPAASPPPLAEEHAAEPESTPGERLYTEGEI
jgi:hypothetical protein